MTKRAFSVADSVLAGFALVIVLSTTQANALPARTWVSGKGSDSNPCSLAAPCRTFAHAINQTAPGGEIDVLDPAGYGSLTITQSISIVNDGVGEAGLQAPSGGTAITINAGSSDLIHLRGLTLEGAGVASYGIQYNSGASLDIVNCVIRHFSSAGISLSPATSTNFSITKSSTSDNGNYGLILTPQATINAVINKLTANNNAFGIVVNGGTDPQATANVTIVNSTISDNSDTALTASSATGSGTATMMLRRVTASNNPTGVSAAGTAIVTIARSILTGNSNAFVFSGVNGTPTINSYGDNDIDGNTNNFSGGTLTSASMH
jgi:hypothetical protein